MPKENMSNKGNLINDVCRFRPTNHASVTLLEFGHEFNQEMDNLSPTITILRLGTYFHSTITLFLSPLTHLALSYHYNINFPSLSSSLIQLEGTVKSLPDISHLTKLNEPVNNLPSSITQLTLGARFNQRVDHLPSSLTRLTFKGNFNQPVNHLPPSHHITFRYSFDQPCLPLSSTLLLEIPTILQSLHVVHGLQSTLLLTPSSTSLLHLPPPPPSPTSLPHLPPHTHLSFLHIRLQ